MSMQPNTYGKFLDKYDIWLGQKISCQQSRVFFSSNIPIITKQGLLDFQQIRQLLPKAKYLSIPLFQWQKQRILNSYCTS